MFYLFNFEKQSYSGLALVLSADFIHLYVHFILHISVRFIHSILRISIPFYINCSNEKKNLIKKILQCYNLSNTKFAYIFLSLIHSLESKF